LIVGFIASCGTTAGSGKSNQCSKQCNAKKKLGCVGEAPADVASCKDECLTTTKGSTSKSVVAVTGCMNEAVSCGQADSCYSKLEEAPVVDNSPTGGDSGGDGSTGGGTGSATGSSTGSTPISPPSGAAGTFLNAYCDKFAECLGEEAGGVENAKQLCMTQATISLLDMVKSIADTGSSAIQCVKDLQCEGMNSTSMATCMGLDLDANTCATETSLKICNLKKQCTNVHCKKICAAFADSALGTCKPDEEGAQCDCD